MEAGRQVSARKRFTPATPVESLAEGHKKIGPDTFASGPNYVSRPPK
jgi:hypothetical protein